MINVIGMFGPALIVAGVIGLIQPDSMFGSWNTAISWAEIVAGVVATVYAAAGFVGRFMGEQRTAEHVYASTEMEVMIDCMGAVAAADGPIEAGELRAMTALLREILGLDIPPDELGRTLRGMNSGFDLTGRLLEARNTVSPTLRRLIVRACTTIMLRDGVADPDEADRVREIGRAFGFSRVETEALMLEAVDGGPGARARPEA